MNKKVKTVLTLGISFFAGMCTLGAMQQWLCDRGEMYIRYKDLECEFGDRKIVPPSSGRYHWNNDSEKEEEVPE